MGLLYYENQFSKLRMNKRDGQVSPHKVAMLLAIIDLFDKDKLEKNKIYFDQELIKEFTNHFQRICSQTDRNNPHLPFFHLRSSGFWHHHIKPGKREAYENLTTASGVGVLNEMINYVYLDDELFELLGNTVVRNLLRETLYKNLEEQDRRSLLDVGIGWDWLECELVVDLYFKILEMQVLKKDYVKSQLYAELVPQLNNRSIKSVEAKCQNVSAVMVQHGYPYVTGLKPLWNYQKQLEKVVLSQLVGQYIKLTEMIDKTLIVSERDEVVIDWNKVLDTAIPKHIPSVKEPKSEYLARRVDYSQRESNNRKLGERGEEFVLEFERYRLAQAGRKDLIDDIEWSSKKQGDGLGYDIRSFDPHKDEELFIEVKTTNSGKYQPFFISQNEVNYSKNYSDKYSLYRVYQFTSDPRLFHMHGNIEQYVNLHAKNYRASFEK